MHRAEVRPSREMLLLWRRELLVVMRKEARRVRVTLRREAPNRSGNLSRRLKLRAGFDRQGPWARITTTASRLSTSKRTGRTTRFRYAFAIQQKTDHLGRGLQKVPRR